MYKCAAVVGNLLVTLQLTRDLLATAKFLIDIAVESGKYVTVTHNSMDNLDIMA